MPFDQLNNSTNATTCSPVFRNVWVCGLLSISLSSFYVAAHLQTGWYPYDDGQLGHAAERVLDGELPHRDFDDMYTGALTYLNALSFQLFGVHSESARWMMWLFFVPFAAAVYWIAGRAGPPWAAGLVTFFCATITIPVYSAAMPSWYNLFFMTWGVASLLRFIETKNKIWIVAAGLCAGLSILFKITGIYWLAAAILFLVFFEQNEETERNEKSIAFDIFVLCCLGVFSLLALKFCQTDDWLLASIHLTLPLLLIAAYVGLRQLQTRKGPFGFRLRRLLKLQLPLIAAALLPVFCWIGIYASQSALADLYEGLIVLPSQRIDGAHRPFPDFIRFSFAVPLALVLAAGFLKYPEWLKKNSWMIAAVFAMVSIALAIFWNQVLGFQITFHALRNIGPFAVVLGVAALICKKTGHGSTKETQQLFLLTAAAATACLVQFPFAANFYFLYAAPIVVLCVAFVSRNSATPVRLIHGGVMGIFTLFAVFNMASPISDANILGTRHTFETDSLNLQKCSLEIEANMANMYRQVVREITSRTQPGEYIYAGPDFPEAYFLSDRKNPTRVFYDFFRPELQQHPQLLLDQLDKHNVNVVAIKKFKVFTELSPDFEKAIRQHYPHHKTINSYHHTRSDENGLAFVIYWRD
jgi:hypothetical protein